MTVTDSRLAQKTPVQEKELSDLLTSKEYTNAAGEIVVPIGMTSKGSVQVLDLAQAPHILVTGFSGSGKTSFAQTIITCIATKYSPEIARFIIYDSKTVDYGVYKSMPHMYVPVITEVTKVEGILAFLRTESSKRMQQLANSGQKDIVSYNRNCTSSGKNTIPHIFVILDDFSSLWLSPRNTDLLETVLVLLKEGRTTGIHLICVTSLPSSKVLSKDILSCIPCRISFCVSTRADSRIVIGQNGAEDLYVPGELIYKWQNTIEKCQGAYLPYGEIAPSIKSIQRREFKKLDNIGALAASMFLDAAKPLIDNTSTQPDAEYDELLQEAASVVFETKQASVSMLQRRLKLGYTRAAKIIDQLEECGLVGPYMGSTPRRILLTPAEWNKIWGDQGLEQPQTFQEPVAAALESLTNLEDKGSIDDEPPDIPMRSFAKFRVGTKTLSISDNLIHLEIKIQTRFGSGTAYPEFNGKSVEKLIYKKPGLFSSGYVQFRMKPNINIINVNPHLLDVTKDTLPDLLKIEFSSAEARTMKLFMTQISEDIGLPITEL